MQSTAFVGGVSARWHAGCHVWAVVLCFLVFTPCAA